MFLAKKNSKPIKGPCINAQESQNIMLLNAMLPRDKGKGNKLEYFRIRPH